MDPADAICLRPSKYNTALAPNWRWERARMLREHGKYARRQKEDPWVVLLMRFQKELDKAKTLIDHERLEARYPALYWAWQIYRNTKRKDTRWIVEAYLCAAASLKHIGDRVSQEPETLGAYALVFFDVIGKTHHKLYMLNEVLGRSVHAGIAERDYDLLWKVLGVLRGPLFLDAFISQDNTPGHVTSTAQLQAAHTGVFRDSMVVSSIKAAKSLPVSYNQEIIFNTMTKLIEVEKANDDPQTKQGMIVNTLNTMFTSMNFSFGRPERLVDAEALKPYDECGAELRADESFQLSLGKALPTKKKLLAMHYPEGKHEQSNQ